MPNPNTATQKDLETPNDSMLYEVSRDIFAYSLSYAGIKFMEFSPTGVHPRGKNWFSKMSLLRL